MEASNGDWQFVTSDETDAITSGSDAPSPAEDIALGIGGEGAVELEVAADSEGISDTVEAAAEGVTADGPTVPVPEGFVVKSFVRLEGEDTPEAREARRRWVEEKTGHRHIGEGGGKARGMGLDPIHTGKKRGRRANDQ